MIGRVVHVGILSCWLYVSCASGLEGQQVLPIDRNLQQLFVNFSTVPVSETCANETQNVLNALPERGISWDCNVKSNTTEAWICSMRYERVVFNLAEADCANAGGQIKENFTNPNYFKCMNENSGDNINFSILYHPICAGVSCNETEVESVFHAVTAAKLNTSFAYSIQYLCNIPTPLSTSYNYNGIMKYVITYLTFTTVVFAIYAF